MNTNAVRVGPGLIEVVTGSMFSGKTEEMLRRLRRARIARQQVQVFKPKLDLRYGHSKVKSHAGAEFQAIGVQSCSEILDLLSPDTTVVAIDEVQFFDPEIVEVCDYLAEQGIRVIVAGLDQDFRGEPFGSDALTAFPGRTCGQITGHLHGVWWVSIPHTTNDRWKGLLFMRSPQF